MLPFIDSQCELVEWSMSLIAQCQEFTCQLDIDIEAFFKSEFSLYNNQLLGKSYGFILNNENIAVAAFTLANSALPVAQFPKSVRNRINRQIPNQKRNNQYPALLLGQLAVFDKFAGHGIGDEVLLFIKTWVSGKSNISGCRYLIVDATNNEKVINFYQRNGFKFIFDTIEEEIEYMRLDLEPEYKRTRLMYFDLILLAS